jgi:disulfide bond formation protein DsbB
MSNDTVSLFLALLAVVGLVFVASTIVMAVVARFRGLGPGGAALRDTVADLALPLGAAVAATCTLGSLYMSEVRNFTPCDLCWYQRIFMYPLVVLLGIAAVRRDRAIWRYVLPLALIGAAVSTYHYLHERFPDSVATSCSLEASCSTLWIWELHFLSIPGMAWVGFVLIATLMLVARSAERRSSRAELPRGDRHDDSTDPSPQEVPA